MGLWILLILLFILVILPLALCLLPVYIRLYKDEEGNPQWEKGTKEETDKVVLEAFDNLFFQADQMRMSGCAMEKLIGKMTRRQIQKYMQYMEEERMKPSDYEYEQYEDED